MGENKEKEGIEYIASKKSIFNSFLKGLLAVLALNIFISMAQENPGKFLVLKAFLSITVFCFLMASFEAIRNYKVCINDEFITFQTLYEPKEPRKYQWKDIHTVIIGEVEVKHSRIPYNVYGIQIFYTDYIFRPIYTFEVYSIGHLENHEKLVTNIQKNCIENSIKFQMQK